MFCSKCGNELLENALFCSKCGINVGATKVEYSALPCTDQTEKRTTNTSNDSILLKSLIGNNADYYLREFERIENGKTSFNWIAFLFGPIMCLYRKQSSVFLKVFLPALLLPFVVYITNFILYASTRQIENFVYMIILNLVTTSYAIGAAVFNGVTFNKSYIKNLNKIIISNGLTSGNIMEPQNRSILKSVKTTVGLPIIVYSIYVILILVLQATAPSAEQLSQASYIDFGDETVIVEGHNLTNGTDSSMTFELSETYSVTAAPKRPGIAGRE